MTREPKDLAASVRQRLMNWSAREALDFQLVLIRYGIERLLYRLSRSPYSDRFVLKGAMLFVAWEGWTPRPTRDVDLLGRGEHSLPSLQSIFQALCQVVVEPDGLVFHPETVEITNIRDDQEYGGHRVRLRATLGQARIDLQADIGYGDAISPPPARITFPALLDLPAPIIMAYPRESVVAEKLHALVTLGIANSRMKDFYDLWLLARQFSFNGPSLARAIQATFERRQTPLPGATPLGLTSDFYDDANKRIQWQAFLSSSRLTGGGPQFEHVVPFLRGFLMPPTHAIVQQFEFNSQWLPGGPWRE